VNSRYVHDLVIRRTDFDDSVAARDDAGQPSRTVTTSEVKGLVQPRRAQELPDSRSAGAEVSDHVVFLPVGTDLVHADAIDWGDRRLQITGIRPFEFGRLQHLEVDARLVTATAVTNDGGS
jgi:hypothetical protein